jgi:hypothetical protein
MRQDRRGVPDVTARLWAASLVLALGAGGAVAQETPMVSRHVMGAPSVAEDAAAAERLVSELDGRIVYIDWLVQGGPEGLGVSLRADLAEPAPDLACEGAGERENLPDAVYEIAPPYGSFHTLLSLRLGDARDFPLSTIACEARSGDPEEFDLRFRGLFFVERTAIPTASAYSLRPLAPDMATLQRLVAAGAFDAPDP